MTATTNTTTTTTTSTSTSTSTASTNDTRRPSESEASAEASMLNGIDVGRLNATMEAIGAEPGLGRFEFRAENRWLYGGQNRTKIQGFYGAGKEDLSRREPFVVDNDEPYVLLGGDQAANPVEYILHGLAGCLTTSLVYHAAARGIRVNAVRSRYEGELDLRGFLGLSTEVTPGYQGIRVVMEVDADASPAEIEELVHLAQRHSPVFDTLSRPVPIVVRLDRA